ncbi:MAG: pyrroloquinoline quinone-dependent dehydrogenase [Acidobacteria bacterium]|nr:MAG: pyrroloquinoline quinone-dependent dehydrogenase [Acidobacteriota bacterium]
MRHRTFMAACTLSLLLSATSQAQRGTSGGQWPNHSGDKGSTKYAPLDQINRSNVRNLHVAWRRPAVADELRGQHQELKFSNLFRSTPLMINGVLYASDGIGLVEAFDPATGRTLWVQESTDLGPEALAGTSTRGIAYWRNGADERILSVRPPYLYAINLKTGELIRSFGEAGRVDLRTGLGPQPQPFNFTSAPLIVKDIAVIGSSIADNPNVKEGTRGDVRGYDVKTGKLRWTFRTIPREREFGVETWEDRSWDYTGAVNAWSNLSADEELGYIYLPLTSPTSDMYGGHRLGNNLFSDSLVCLKAETGERVWHFQLVHHDLWDYDLPAAPILADIRVNGKPIKAVVQVTKQGFAFVFDRVTGQPVWPIEERPVPQSATPGERTAPTQPFPTKPAPFERQGVSVDDLIDFTPELRSEAIDITKRYVVGPLFTPPSIKGDGPNDTKGTLQLPGSVGGADWNGAALDPETGILYVPSVTGTFAADLVSGNTVQSNLRYVHGTREFVTGPRGLPLFKPPYGRITAINLNTGDHVWVKPNGDGPREHPAIKHLNLPPLGQPGRASPLVTKTLFFIGDGDPINVRTPPGGGGRKFRAYDKASGAVVWEMEFPAGTTGAPMTYMYKGKQYIAFAIGSNEHQAEFVALALR